MLLKTIVKTKQDYPINLPKTFIEEFEGMENEVIDYIKKHINNIFKGSIKKDSCKYCNIKNLIISYYLDLKDDDGEYKIDWQEALKDNHSICQNQLILYQCSYCNTWEINSDSHAI